MSRSSALGRLGRVSSAAAPLPFVALLTVGIISPCVAWARGRVGGLGIYGSWLQTVSKSLKRRRFGRFSFALDPCFHLADCSTEALWRLDAGVFYLT